jgi:predicted dehydrogenase
MAEKFGVAVLGTGWVAGEHIKAFQQNPHTEVVALLSRDKARAEARAAEFGLADCRACTDLDQLLKDERVRIVSVCTPHHLHAAQAIAAAGSGRHVVVEKPIALDQESLDALDAAIARAGVKSVVSFVLRWNPLVETIKTMLADDLVGDLYYAEVDYMHDIGPWYTGYEWIIQKRYGGNCLLTGGCHAVDALRYFVGQEAVEVFSYANTSRKNHLKFEYDPNALTAIKFADGLIGKVSCSLEAMMPYAFPILLMGDRGAIRNNQFVTRRWPGQKGWATVPTILPDTAEVSHHPFVGEMNHFVDCILNGRESHCNVADAVKTHRICLAAEVSAREGKPVRL